VGLEERLRGRAVWVWGKAESEDEIVLRYANRLAATSITSRLLNPQRRLEYLAGIDALAWDAYAHGSWPGLSARDTAR